MRTLRIAVVTIGLGSLVLGACSTEPNCTDSSEPAITVRAIDGFTGENVTDGAAGTVSEDAFVDSLRPALWETDGRVLKLRGADERAGSYDLWIEREGYQAVSILGIEVTRNECHVNTVDMNVTMVPFSSP